MQCNSSKVIRLPFHFAVLGTDYIPDRLVFTFNSTGEQCNDVVFLKDESIEGDHTFSVSVLSTNLGIMVDESRNITIFDINGKFMYRLYGLLRVTCV